MKKRAKVLFPDPFLPTNKVIGESLISEVYSKLLRFFILIVSMASSAGLAKVG
jgi:hypothetical protein